MDTPRTLTVKSDSTGWVVAVILLILVAAGATAWYFYDHRTVVQETTGPSINVTLPGVGNEELSPTTQH